MDDGKRSGVLDVADDRTEVTEPLRTADDPSVPPSNRVLNAVAAERGVAVLDLPPLYEVIDPDALDALFETRPNESGTRSGTVTFEYADFTVVVCSDGVVSVL